MTLDMCKNWLSHPILTLFEGCLTSGWGVLQLDFVPSAFAYRRRPTIVANWVFSAAGVVLAFSVVAVGLCASVGAALLLVAASSPVSNDSTVVTATIFNGVQDEQRCRAETFNIIRSHGW
ncbi:hypothetical protein ARTHRO9AX_130047 [Arthrobacter sp. 9AX]|nr:hypothetical protein ARTHRO9AX_130047 [Arthrobacter sp. 9AX]